LVKAGENKHKAEHLKEKADKSLPKYRTNPPSFKKLTTVKTISSITKKGSRGMRAAEQHALVVV
jgi:hypothetical protein